MQKDTKSAFIWITDILDKHNIEYRITGGFASRLYGANRELADIDIEVKDEDIIRIKDEVFPFIIFGPGAYLDNEWNVNIMTLNYLGQTIDISGNSARIFDKEHSKWIDLIVDFFDTKMFNVYGKDVKVISLNSLISYKKILKREVDLIDVHELGKIYTEYSPRSDEVKRLA